MRYGAEAVAVLAAVTAIGVLLYLVRYRKGTAADDDYPADPVEAD